MYDCWVSGLVFWVSGLIFYVSDLYFDCLDLYFMFLDSYCVFWTYILGVWTYTSGIRVGSGGSTGSAGSGGRPGRVSSTFGGKPIWGICIRKKVTIDYIIEFWTWGILQKRRAPKNAAFWRAARAEISHMRPIRGRKLKLIIWVVCGMGNHFPRRNQGAWTSSRVGTETQFLVPASGEHFPNALIKL